MKKQKNVVFYVFLILVSMFGIGSIVLQKELVYRQEKTNADYLLDKTAVEIFLSQSDDFLSELAQGVTYDAEENVAEENEIQREEGAFGETAITIGTEDVAYFDDALFIGDSRTVGIQEYGYLENADFFADVSMSVYKIENAKINLGNGKKKLEEILTENTYGKVYVMLGINELGYDFDYTLEKYKTLLAAINEAQPEAIIYICGNLHVTKEQSEADEYFNNVNINHFNEAISQLEDGETFFYIDINELFDDAEGNLGEEYSSDEAHVMGKYYETWCDWLLSKAVILNDAT